LITRARVLTAAIVCTAAALIGTGAVAGGADPAHVVEARSAEAASVTGAAQDRIARLRGQLLRERARARAVTARLKRQLLARPDVQHAIALGAAAYGVPVDRLRRVALCESRFDPQASAGLYLGLFQFGRVLWRTTPFSRFDRSDPYAAAFAASWAFARGLSGHWPVCGRY
jgi:hypothetical protein